MKTKRILAALIAVIVIICGANVLRDDDKNFEISKHMNIFATLFREKSLDPYTVYYPESEMEDVKLMTTGEYAGIGSIISKKGDEVIIREPYKNSPADLAGLLPGDVILSIDGHSTKGKDVESVSEMLKGQPGKEITLKIQR